MEKLSLIRTGHLLRFVLSMTVVMLGGCSEARSVAYKVGTHDFDVPAAHFRQAGSDSVIFLLDPQAPPDRQIVVAVQDAARFCREHPDATDAVRSICSGSTTSMGNAAYQMDDLEKVPVDGSAQQWTWWLKPAKDRERTYLANCSQWGDAKGSCGTVQRVGDLILSFDLPSDEVTQIPAYVARIEALLRRWES